MAGTAFFLIIALMAAIYVFLYSFDYDKLKPRIARMVKDATGRELDIGGKIELVIGFFPALMVTDITFSNASWGSQPHMIKMDELQAQVRLLPLLTREVDLRKIAFTGVEVLLETGPDGKGNWEFPSDQGSAKPPGTSRAMRINADNIRFENLGLTLRNGKTGSATRFTLADLKVAEQPGGGKLAVDLRAAHNGQTLTLAGKTGLVRELLGSERFSLDLSGAFSNAAIRLEGAIDDVINLTGIDLRVQTSGKNLAELKLTQNIQLPKTNAFDLAGYLRGSKKSLALNELSGNLSAGDANLTFSGKVGDLVAISDIDLQLKGSGKNLSVLGAIIGEKLPTTDEFMSEGRITGSAKALSLQAVQGRAESGRLNVAVYGEVRDLIAFSGVDLKVTGSGKDLAEVGVIIDRKLPATDEFALEGRLTGSAAVLTLKNAQATARRGRLHIALNGGVQNLLTFRGLDLQSRLNGTDLAEFGEIIATKLPATDQFEIQGRLTGSVTTLALKQASGKARRGSLNLALKGQIMDLLDLGGMDLHLQGSGKDLAEAGPLFGKKLPATDEFRVQGRLKGSAKALSLLEAEGHASRGGLILTATGGITELLALEGINVKLNASGKELAQIGPLVGAELPGLGPFNLNGKLSGSTQVISLKEFSATIDNSDFNGLAVMEFLQRPKITVRLESSVIDFTALMKSLEKDSHKPAEKDRSKQRLFSDDPLPFEALKKVDADVELKAKNMHAKDALLEFGNLKLKLENGDFRVDTLEATYKQTKISGTLHLNPGSPSHAATKFLVQNFDLGGFLRETGVSDQARGLVDIAADLESSGNSVHALMANLNGTAGVVMGQGYLTKYLDLLAANLAQRVISFWGQHQKAGDINCAAVQLDIDNGLVKNQVFVVDSPIAILTVAGDTNLATEKLNLLLSPDPKNPALISLSTKLRVTGSISDPKVRPDMASLAIKGAKALSSLLVGPVGLLAPFVHLGANKKHPCDVKRLEKYGLAIPAEE